MYKSKIRKQDYIQKKRYIPARNHSVHVEAHYKKTKIMKLKDQQDHFNSAVAQIFERDIYFRGSKKYSK